MIEIKTVKIKYLRACLVGFAVVTEVIEFPEGRPGTFMSISFGTAVVWTRYFYSFPECSMLRGDVL